MAKEEDPINLFIDTNILLGFYRFTKDDLETLSKLEDIIIKTKKIKLYVTQQQVDEFYRNRDAVIHEGINSIKVDKPRLPKAFAEHSEYSNVVQESRELVDKINTIKQDTLKQAQDGKLTADAVAKNLFDSPIPTTPAIIDAARLRVEVGNPPGKKGSLGDAIHWEILLESVERTDMLTDIHIITDDVDFRSALDDSTINTFLSDEWSKKKFGTAHLYRSLNSFFSKHFPDIELVDEAIKDGLIEQIGTAGSFDSARSLIRRLYDMGNLSEGQAKSLYKSSCSNDQVYNAHTYSPSIVGDRLWELIEPHWKSFSGEEQEAWVAMFPDETLREMHKKQQ